MHVFIVFIMGCIYAILHLKKALQKCTSYHLQILNWVFTESFECPIKIQLDILRQCVHKTFSENSSL